MSIEAYPEISTIVDRALDRLTHNVHNVKDGAPRSEIQAAICELTMIKVKIKELINIYDIMKEL